MSNPAGSDGKLSLAEIVAIGIGGMVGGGIFAVLGLAIETAGHAVAIAMVFGGVVALLTGISYAHLGLAFRDDGGSFTYVEHAFDNTVAGRCRRLAAGRRLRRHARALRHHLRRLWRGDALRRRRAVLAGAGAGDPGRRRLPRHQPVRRRRPRAASNWRSSAPRWRSWRSSPSAGHRSPSRPTTCCRCSIRASPRRWSQPG